VRWRLALALAVSALLGSLALAACGGDDDEGDVGEIQPVAADCGEVQYSGSDSASKLIVSDLPLQGDSAERSAQMNDAIVTRVEDGITGSFVITPTGDAAPAPISVERAAEEFELAKTITPSPELIKAARGG